MSAEYPMENWLTEEYDYESPQPGEIREGVLLELDQYGAVVDVGMKHDGIVPREDIERLEEEALSNLQPGQEIMTKVVRASDREGALVLSLAYVQEEKDWARAQEMLENNEIWHGEVTGYNRGGLLVKFRHLTGFVPASHLVMWDSGLNDTTERKRRLKMFLGEELKLKVIEANRDNNRLILSERLARRQLRKQNQGARLNDFTAGEVRQGVVCNITNFGAFVDLGGIDGLIHISELSWQRVNHPKEVVQVGDEVDVYLLQIDYERKRINLSLKRLQPNPWNNINEYYAEGQLVTGRVSNVVSYGAFIALDSGVEGLLHASEIAQPTPHDPREFVERGEELTLRILRIEPDRQRIALSLKEAPTNPDED